MKSASSTPTDATVLPEEPPGGGTAGLDCARDDHAVSVVDDGGRELDRCTVAPTAAGLRELVAFLHAHGAVEVAIERPESTSPRPPPRGPHPVPRLPPHHLALLARQRSLRPTRHLAPQRFTRTQNEAA